LTPEELSQLEHCWAFWARPNQKPPPGDWFVWLILAGRGFGKTRTGAETINMWAESGACRRMALVGRTATDVRDVMVEGKSGIVATSPPHFRAKYEAVRRRVVWPNGAIATMYSADEPNLLRGPEHDGAWVDELAAWRYVDAWHQLLFGLRIGAQPRVIATTTPRPTKLIRELVAEAEKPNATVAVTRGSTYENAANLSQVFLGEVTRQFAGTRLGRQELEGAVLLDTPGALWTHEMVEAAHAERALPKEYRRCVVSIDPAVSTTETSDETGLVVAATGPDGHGYVLEDRSGKYSPDAWARLAVQLYRQYDADRIIAEVNNGGDLVLNTIKTVDPRVRTLAVRATRGKRTRAEPVAALYEQHRVTHAGYFPQLDDQLTTWDATDPRAKSPDRLDALVWALTDLMVTAPAPPRYKRAAGADSRWRANTPRH
jgi:predicted phage terminase large subunit-like protein